MNYTIQEIEKINFNENELNPEELLPMAKQMIKIKKHEKAFEIIESAIVKIKNKNNSNSHIECAPYYYHYADALISKLMDQEELFANPDENNIQNEHNSHNNIENKSITESDNEDESKTELPISDEEVAFENLAAAEAILKDYFEENEKIENNDLNKYYDIYANVYLKFGELEMCKSDFKTAIEFFEKSLEIRKKYEDKFSRAIAELYFNMGSIYDFDSKKCLLCYYKTKIILEHHLIENLEGINLEIVKKEMQIKESYLNDESIEPEKVIIHTSILEKFKDENLSEEALELKDILIQIYTKV